MVDTNELENFLSEKIAKDGDICVITADGKIEQKQDVNSGRKYKVISFPVQCNGKDLVWTPDKAAVAVFQKEYGMDSVKWIGKKFSIKLYPKKSFGKDVIGILPVLLDVKIK